MRPLVLIFSQLGEPGTASVTAHLEKLGVDFVRLDYELLFLNSTWSFSSETGIFSIRTGDTVVTNRNVTCVWNRRWGIPLVPSKFNTIETQFAFNELQACFVGFYHSTRSKWVNDLEAERRWSNKIAQLQLASELGARTPRTIVTSAADDVYEFYNKEANGVVFKSTSGTAPFLNIYSPSAHEQRELLSDKIELSRGVDAPSTILFTQQLDADKLTHIDGIRWGPVTFQEKISKRCDMRVSVIYDEIVGCEIASQENKKTSLDFRKFAFGAPIMHKIVQVPDTIKKFIVNYMHHTNLRFGFFDFAVEAETDEWVFLECNPNGQWSWIDDIGGGNITELVALYLRDKASQLKS